MNVINCKTVNGTIIKYRNWYWNKIQNIKLLEQKSKFGFQNWYVATCTRTVFKKLLTVLELEMKLQDITNRYWNNTNTCIHTYIGS